MQFRQQKQIELLQRKQTMLQQDQKKRIEIHHNTPEQKHVSKSCNLCCFQALTRHHQTTTAGLTSLGHQLSDCCRGNNFQLVWLGLRGYLGRGRLGVQP